MQTKYDGPRAFCELCGLAERKGWIVYISTHQREQVPERGPKGEAQYRENLREIRVRDRKSPRVLTQAIGDDLSLASELLLEKLSLLGGDDAGEIVFA